MKKISVLMATAFVEMMGFAIVFPLLPFYALNLGAEPWKIGFLIAAFSIAQLASAPLWGRVSDHYGRRPALLIGLSASAMAFIVFAFATSIWMLLLSRFIQGAGGGTTGVAQAYVGDSIAPKDRAKALGWLSAATGAGVMIGPAIGSLATTISIEAPGLIAATLCVLAAAFAWRWLPESSPGKGRNAVPDAPGAPPMTIRPVREVFREVVRHPQADVSRLVWIYAAGMLGFMSMTGIFALYLEASFGITEKTIGLFFVYTGALSVVVRALILGKLVDRFGETRVMRMGAVSLMVGLATIPLPTDVFTLMVVVSLVPIGTACLFPNVSALTTHRAREGELGQTLGVQQSFGGMARVLAPVWATAAFQGFGPDVPFFIAAGVVAVVTVLAFRVREKIPAPEPQAAGG